MGYSDEAVVAIDDQGVIVEWNEAATRLLGWPASQAVGSRCYDVLGGVTPAGAPLCCADCQIQKRCADGFAPRRFEMVARRRDGGEVWLDVTTVVVLDGDHPVSVHVLAQSAMAARLERLGESVARKLSAEDRMPHGPVVLPDAPTIRPDCALSSREREVLAMLAEGASTDEVATKLSLSPTTVRNHIQSIFGKMGVHSRTEAVVVAARAGLVNIAGSR